MNQLIRSVPTRGFVSPYRREAYYRPYTRERLAAAAELALVADPKRQSALTRLDTVSLGKAIPRTVEDEMRDRMLGPLLGIRVEK